MKTIKAKGFENRVELSGVIRKMDEYIRYIPAPMVSFELDSLRKRRTEEDELVYDLNRVIVFDDESFLEHYATGDRVRIKGELQSRNYTRDHYEVDEAVQNAVDIYVEVYENAPCKKQPKGRVRQPIDWSKLMEMKLLGQVPSDSMRKEDGTKEKTEESPYVYRVDENHQVYKETEHTAYEVIAFEVAREEEPEPGLAGDVNRVTLTGRLTKDPNFDILGVPFANSTVQTRLHYFKDKERVAYLNFIAWSHTAEEVFNELKRGDKVRLSGRLQSRTYTKTLTLRWKTPAGNNKKKNVERTFLTREISVSKIFKAEFTNELEKGE